MTTIHSGDTDCPIAPLLSISSARLRSLILKKHLTTLNAQLKTDKKGRLSSYKNDIAHYIPNIPNYTNKPK